MGIFDFFNFKNKIEGTVVGSFESTAQQVPNAVLGLAQNVGILSPSNMQGYSSKTISITKKKDKYIVTLNNFNPPVQIEWSSTIPLHQLVAFIDSLTETDRHIGYISLINSDSGRFFQVATTK